MYLAGILTFSAIFHYVCCDIPETSNIVVTKQGKVEGGLAQNGNYYEYLGIKYGVPVKFRAPKEPPSFSDVFKADNRAIMCPQFPSYDPLAAPSENEDCLVLNIYSPYGVTYHNNTLPVMVFLHGGGFGIGSASATFYNPQYLVSQGVVVVTVNYRLNVYGFLNLGIPGAPGNAGLKDIRAALRWIQSNIKNFGGDPNNVTVFGQGSGGTAAIYLTLSNSTRGLFHRIISESGCLFTPQSFDDYPLNTAAQVAKTLEVNSEDPEVLLKLYTEKPIVDVEEAIYKQMHPNSVFIPSVEDDFVDEEAFLTDTPYNILKTGRSHECFNPVPAIVGLNTVDGLTSILDYNTITSQMERLKYGDSSVLDQRNLKVPDDEKEEVRNGIKDTYFTKPMTDESLIGGLINLNTDFSYVGPMSLFTELYANNSGQPLYEYIFNYHGNRNIGRILTNSSLSVTANRDELFYIFEFERMPLPMDYSDARMITFLTMMWSNFAATGSPTPDSKDGEWLPYPHHLAIALEPEYVGPLTPERALFWRTFYEKYGTEIPKQELI